MSQFPTKSSRMSSTKGGPSLSLALSRSRITAHSRNWSIWPKKTFALACLETTPANFNATPSLRYGSARRTRTSQCCSTPSCKGARPTRHSATSYSSRAHCCRTRKNWQILTSYSTPYLWWSLRRPNTTGASSIRRTWWPPPALTAGISKNSTISAVVNLWPIAPKTASFATAPTTPTDARPTLSLMKRNLSSRTIRIPWKEWWDSGILGILASWIRVCSVFRTSWS